MASQVVIKPTFLLKGINPFALADDYDNGKLKLNDLKVEKAKITTVVLANNRGKTFRQGIYCFRNRDNVLQTLATSGAKNFSFYDEKGENKKGGICMVCRDEFKGQSIGVIVKLSQDKDTISVYSLGTTCGFRCSLRLTRSLRRERNSINFIHSEQFLKFVYRRMYPDKPDLTPSPDPLLLDINGGSLNRDEYDDNKYVYVNVPNLILYPAKEQYLRFQAN